MSDLRTLSVYAVSKAKTGGSTLFTIKWTGFEPTEAGWSPPSDTKQPHAQGSRYPLAFFASLIAKMHACSAVDLLAFCTVGLRQHRSQSADAFEEFTQLLLRQLTGAG